MWPVTQPNLGGGPGPHAWGACREEWGPEGPATERRSGSARAGHGSCVSRPLGIVRRGGRRVPRPSDEAAQHEPARLLAAVRSARIAVQHGAPGATRTHTARVLNPL